MPIAKITGPGLTSIAILVALLWTCVIGERLLAGRAYADTVETVRAMLQLRRRALEQPAAAPAPHRQKATRIHVG